MKKIIVTVVCSLVLAASVAMAADVTLTGEIKSISISGSSAIVTVKDGKTGKEVKVTVKDELTIDKFKDKRIQEGAEVRVKYDSSSGVTKLFRKTAGC